MVPGETVDGGEAVAAGHAVDGGGAAIVASSVRAVALLHKISTYSGADLGLLQWWGCNINAREKFRATPT